MKKLEAFAGCGESLRQATTCAFPLPVRFSFGPPSDRFRLIHRSPILSIFGLRCLRILRVAFLPYRPRRSLMFLETFLTRTRFLTIRSPTLGRAGRFLYRRYIGGIALRNASTELETLGDVDTPLSPYVGLLRLHLSPAQTKCPYS